MRKMKNKKTSACQRASRNKNVNISVRNCVSPLFFSDKQLFLQSSQIQTTLAQAAMPLPIPIAETNQSSMELPLHLAPLTDIPEALHVAHDNYRRIYTDPLWILASLIPVEHGSSFFSMIFLMPLLITYHINTNENLLISFRDF